VVLHPSPPPGWTIPRYPGRLASLLLVGLLLLPNQGRSDQENLAEDTEGLTNLEEVIAAQPSLRAYLESAGRTLATTPSGKRIRGVLLRCNPVFDDYDPYPDFPNLLHVTTRDEVIQAELVFQPGQTFTWARADETVRNLNAKRIFAFVTVLPLAVEGAPDEVELLVYTKDLWSLRLENDLSIEGTDDVEYLYLSLSERNFLGLDKTIALFGEWQRDTFNLGQYYEDVRFSGSALTLTQQSKVYLRRRDFGAGNQDGRLEGGRVGLSLGLPLRTLDQQYGYGASFAASRQISRSFIGNEVRTRTISLDDEEYEVQEMYHRREVSGGLHATRSFGNASTLKNDLKLGCAAGYVHYEAEEDNFPEDAPDGLLARYEASVLPQSENQLYPYVAWTSFEPEYRKFVNLQTFGLTEALRMGYYFSHQLDLSRRWWYSDNDFVRLTSSLSYRGLFGDDIYLFSLSGSGRWQGGELINRRVSVVVRNTFPKLFGGRLHAQLGHTVLARSENGAVLSFGGSATGLRGVVANLYRGQRRAVLNLEYRTLPLRFLGLNVGAVAFHDAGDVFYRYADFDLKASVGGGLRILVPQFNIDPLRLDVGVPYLGRGFKASYLSIQWDQMF